MEKNAHIYFFYFKNCVLFATTEVTLIKATYNGMMMKTHRLQSNRICLQVLSGGLEEEVGHPDRVSFFCLFPIFSTQNPLFLNQK